MPLPNEAKLVATLPENVRTLLAKALELDVEWANRNARDAAFAALEAAGFSAKGPLPLATDLTKEQRALAEIFAGRPNLVFSKYLPRHAYWRRRWLGLEPPGVLEREEKGVPLWRRLAPDGTLEDDSLMEAKLSIDDRLEIHWDVIEGAYRLEPAYPRLLKWGKLAEVTAEQAPIAVRSCNRGRGFSGDPNPYFKALLLAKVPIEPAWDALIPHPTWEGSKWPDAKETRALYNQIITSLPEERRGKAIVKSFQFGNEVAVGLQLLAEFPLPEVADYVLKAIPQSDYPARKAQARLKELGFGAGAKPGVELVITRTLKPKTLAELTPLEQKQLEAAGKAYDGKEGSAEDRFAAFKGFLEIRDVADKKAKKPAYVVFLYETDSGSIFKAGSAKEIAGINQSSLECDNQDLRAALLEVVGDAKPKTKKAAAKKRPR